MAAIVMISKGMHNKKNNIYEKWLMHQYLKGLNEEVGGWSAEEIAVSSGYYPDPNEIAERIRHQYFMNIYRRLSPQPPLDA